MKKMRIEKNKDVSEIVEGFKVAAATAVELVAVIIAIPAKIMLVVAKGLNGVAQKLVGGKDDEVAQAVDPDQELIAEITDV